MTSLFKRLITENVSLLWRLMAYCYFLGYKPKRYFSFGNALLKYFYHKENNTYDNERCIELPIVFQFMRQHKNKSFLEVGNVLHRYVKCTWPVLDKYDTTATIVQDIVGFKPKNKYDLIFSISTLEHAGFDEEQKDKIKPVKGLQTIKGALNKNGLGVVTLPLGYNPDLDRYLFKKTIFSELIFMKRVRRYVWKQVPKKAMVGCKYGKPFPGANGLAVGILRM